MAKSKKHRRGDNSLQKNVSAEVCGGGYSPTIPVTAVCDVSLRITENTGEVKTVNISAGKTVHVADNLQNREDLQPFLNRNHILKF